MGSEKINKIQDFRVEQTESRNLKKFRIKKNRNSEKCTESEI